MDNYEYPSDPYELEDELAAEARRFRRRVLRGDLDRD